MDSLLIIIVISLLIANLIAVIILFKRKQPEQVDNSQFFKDEVNSLKNTFNQSFGSMSKDIAKDMIGALTRVDLTHNKVATCLVARNMSLRGGLPIFVVRHLSKTLEELDLSNNCIDHIDDTIENFHKLIRFDIRNNCLGRRGRQRRFAIDASSTT
mgnify:CR=1 FL=1